MNLVYTCKCCGYQSNDCGDFVLCADDVHRCIECDESRIDDAMARANDPFYDAYNEPNEWAESQTEMHDLYLNEY